MSMFSLILFYYIFMIFVEFRDNIYIYINIIKFVIILFET